jgi:hypothetical protein
MSKKYNLLKKYILILKAADLEKKYKSFKKVRYGNPEVTYRGRVKSTWQKRNDACC